MTIIKCDICGKEIYLTDSKYKVLFDNKNWVEERDICVPCFERIEKELKTNYRIMGIVGYKCPKCGQGNFINSETHCVYCGEPLIKD